MIPFLKQVASHYFSKDDGAVSRRVFVFPNRRALIFFKKYLAGLAAEKGAVLRAPAFYTINEFFYKVCDATLTDRITLLLDLYSCYRDLRKDAAEPLDEFIFWGDMLLSDFADIDKYLVDAERIFTNTAQFKNIQDYSNYLSPTQIEAITKFVEHFTLRSADKKYKRSFLSIWDILYPLYRDFNAKLTREGKAYEGKVYREIASRMDAESAVDILAERFGDFSGFVFIGLNALNECEKKVLSKMRDAGIAEFCWDYSGPLIKDGTNRSSLFMDSNVERFPQAFKLDVQEPLKTPSINVLSIPSSVGQASQLREIFSRIGGGHGLNTAVVLPDEAMLLPVLNSIPPEIGSINVTMGYPMGASAIWDLMDEVASMQMHLREKDGRWYFYHRQVYAIFSNSLFKAVATSEAELEAIAKVKKESRYFIAAEDLAKGPLGSIIFRPVVKDPKSTSLIAGIEDYQTEIVDTIGRSIKGDSSMALELDFARAFHLAIGRIRSAALDIAPATYFRLLSQTVARESVPFKGEPLRGLQIMGPLETRALDFENVIVLSCNEGTFPRRSVGESFIPAELRKGFGLPTYEYQDAVWAYYFYRLIQRASNVWLVYDSRTEVSKSGEESRYIKQLELGYGIPVNRFVFGTGLKRAESGDGSIPKTEEHVQKIREHSLSATSLQAYLTCPARFYFHKVEGLQAEDEVQESLDAGMIGSVFHSVMERLYKGRPKISKEYLRSLGEEDIRKMVEEEILKEMKSFDISGRNLVYEDMICQYVQKVIFRDLELMKLKKVDSFEILGVERPLHGTFPEGFKFYGIADRIDRFTPGEVRIVDYKTGKVLDTDFRIDESNAGDVVEALFRGKVNDKPKIALQMYLYDRFIPDEFKKESVVNSIYSTGRIFTEPVPEIRTCQSFRSLMDEELSKVLQEIADTSVPFRRTDDVDNACNYCDFKIICGR